MVSAGSGTTDCIAVVPPHTECWVHAAWAQAIQWCVVGMLGWFSAPCCGVGVSLALIGGGGVCSSAPTNRFVSPDRGALIVPTAWCPMCIQQWITCVTEPTPTVVRWPVETWLETMAFGEGLMQAGGV